MLGCLVATVLVVGADIRRAIQEQTQVMRRAITVQAAAPCTLEAM
jgi:hypothetical protein